MDRTCFKKWYWFFVVFIILLLFIGSVLVLTAEEPVPTTGNYFNNGGTLNIISSSHQDIAWMDDPHSCMLFRVDNCITPALELMAKNKSYSFVMENMLNLMEFLEVHPEKKGEIERLTKEGRLEWGATFNQPYESSISGEELIRGTYFGRRWLKKTFPGCDAKVAFNPDVPGRSLQMQQILSKAGIPYLIISRYHEGLYRWLSPDGSGVIAYTPGHYGNPLFMLTAPPAEGVRLIAKKLEEQGAYYEKRQIPPAYCLLNSQDFSRPTDFNALINLWNSQSTPAGAVEPNKTAGKPATMQYSSARGFFDQVAKRTDKLDTLLGERPDIWLYITGATHHEAFSAKREASVLLPAAEIFSTVDALLSGGMTKYPAARLSKAWMSEIYPDHGWGGKNGHITDELFKSKTQFARAEGQKMLDEALRSISEKIKTPSQKGEPVRVFNALTWKRSAPVLLNVDASAACQLMDAAGNAVPFQLTSLEEPDEINVAATKMGAKAQASSALGVNYGAEKAIDGKWSNLNTDRWVSSADAKAPHWLMIDFGQPREVHKVVIRHEGSLGAYQDEEQFNTVDFQLQWANATAGPWKNLVSAVTGNNDVLTTHQFAPRKIQFLRLFITRGAARIDDPARIFEVEAFSPNPHKKQRLLFVARDVPAIGYKTYYMAKGQAAAKKPETQPATVPEVFENNYYRIKLVPGGIQSIQDKEYNKELLQTGKFLGAEVYTMESVGNGAGEFPAVQQPTMKGFDKLSNHKPEWKQIESGSVRTVFAMEQALPNCTIRQRVLVYQQIKQIDCELSVLNWNGKKYREFRMALPINMTGGQVAYEVPMGIVEVGKGEIPTTGGLAYKNQEWGDLNYYEQCSKIRPREVQNFINVSDGGLGVTMSSSVVTFDYQDPTTNPVDYPVISPILFASRKSCHGEGNWYLQPGDHHYHFSLSSHAPGWQNGYQFGIQANHPFIVLQGGVPAAHASLPEEKSFFEFSSANVLLSTIKKAEDDDDLVFRVYEMEGKDTPLSIHSFVPFTSGEWTNLIEEEGKPLAVRGSSFNLRLGHNAIETVKLRPALK
jgi:hypothetical protein